MTIGAMTAVSVIGGTLSSIIFITLLSVLIPMHDASLKLILVAMLSSSTAVGIFKMLSLKVSVRR